MHEVSIAHAIVSTVSGTLGPADGRVTSVRILVGDLAAVVPDALLFAYDVAAAGTELEGSRLIVDSAPIVVNCPRCGHGRLTDYRDFRCPTCGDVCGDVVSGRELEIVDVQFAGSDPGPREREIREGVLAKNDLLADGLRARFRGAGVHTSNWVSSPGTGKTELLEAVLRTAIARGLRPAALVGDCATDNDAVRLARSGAQVRQIVTDGNCHLESDMVSARLEGWDLDVLDLLVVENVGNLVCPASYDLGEDMRVALLSVTEGEDKPLKYPKIFTTADIVVITKVDIAEPVQWRRDVALDAVRCVNPDALVIETSARTGVGVDRLLDALMNHTSIDAASSRATARV